MKRLLPCIAILGLLIPVRMSMGALLFNVANLECIDHAWPTDVVNAFHGIRPPVCPISKRQKAERLIDLGTRIAGNPPSERILAKLAWDSNNVPASIKHLKRFVIRRPDGNIWPLILGNLYLYNGQVNKALGVWQEHGLTRPPFQIGHQFAAQGDYEKAIAAFDAAIAANPVEAVRLKAYTAKAGIAYYRIHNVNLAIRTLQDAIDADPLYDESYVVLSRIYRLEDQAHKSSVVANLGIQRIGETYSLLVARSEAWVALGQTNIAIDELKGAISLSPEKSDAWFWLGWAYRDAEDYRRAEESFLKAILLGQKEGLPRESLAYYYAELGRLYEMWGKQSKAVSSYQMGLEINPSAGYIQDRLNSLLGR